MPMITVITVTDFKAPKTNPLFVAMGDFLCPWTLSWNGYESVEITLDGLEKFRELRGKRAILCPNHSHAHDPFMLWLLSMYIGEDFRYIAAREIFEWWHGLFGWLLQRGGAYSVSRDGIDRNSLLTTQEIIVKGKNKLVAFPECEISNRYDRLLPVEEGFTSLLLRSMVQVQGKDPGAPVYVVPISLKYLFNQDISKVLNNALVRIENTLGIIDRSGSLEKRFLIARRKMFHAICAELNLPISAFDNWKSKEVLSRFDDRARVSRLNALYSFSDLEMMSQEVLSAGIDLIERELYTRVSQKGKRRVLIDVGDPINLAEHCLQYQVDKRKEAAWLAQEIETQLASMLGVLPAKIDKAA